MTFKEGQRVRLIGKAWGYTEQNREVYARITFADGGWAKVDEHDVTLYGAPVNGWEVEPA